MCVFYMVHVVFMTLFFIIIIVTIIFMHACMRPMPLKTPPRVPRLQPISRQTKTSRPNHGQRDGLLAVRGGRRACAGAPARARAGGARSAVPLRAHDAAGLFLFLICFKNLMCVYIYRTCFLIVLHVLLFDTCLER